MKFVNKDYSIIDANLTRVKEGIRVVEDFCRFVLSNVELYNKLRVLRHECQYIGEAFGSALTVQGRKSGDVAKRDTKDSEYSRDSAWSIVRANLSRAMEGARVLEEFGKIYLDSELVYGIEDLRYRLYALEYQVLTQTPHYWMQIYFSTGVVYPISSSLEELIWFVDHGAKVIQLRDKTGSKSDIYDKTKFICQYLKKCQERNPKDEPVLFFLNDEVEIASRLPVSGVHIGQDDISVKMARSMLGTNRIIGKSNNNLTQIKNSINEGADYVSIGPIFPTDTKPDRILVGLSPLPEIVRMVAVPIVGIGGITKENVKDVYKTGIKNIALISHAKDFFEI